LWYWNSSYYFPFDPELRNGDTFQNTVTWMHANSIHWDTENDVVYLNGRALDTFYKIDKTTGDVLWAAGRLGDFTLYNKAGDAVDSLWYHSHGLEYIGENRFIMFDNDYKNLTRLETGGDQNDGTPRLIELEVNEETMQIHEIWSWTAPSEYYGRPWGDADRLPGGNTLGDFGWINTPNWLTEVNSAGHVVWEAKFVNTTDYEFGLYRVERYYEEPIVTFSAETTLADAADFKLTLNVWNTFKERGESDAKVVISLDETILEAREFKFKSSWQLTVVEFTIDADKFNAGINLLEVTVTNADGKSAVHVFALEVAVSPTSFTSSTTDASTESNGSLQYSLLGIVFIAMMTYLFRKKQIRSLY
ncbi:MAG: aryl-sulfate sulfotransferase, partial [Candidatus Heimdallarchaeota archaeon]|nr:aryl-sulfate sulfotransferase [Candidatus Heimdallarchaeota archaeon]